MTEPRSRSSDGGAASASSVVPSSGRAWEQTGIDCSGLELRLLGHYLHPYDSGEFAARVSTPGLDIHAENAKITGLTRADTKTVTYAFLYGAGNLKLGMGVGVKDEEVETLANGSAATGYINWLQQVAKKERKPFIRPDDQTLAYWVRGKEVAGKFLAGITGLKELKTAITEEAKRGFIIAIDGRKLSIRSPHVAINQLLQGGGAVVCKMWMLDLDAHLRAKGLVEDVDYGQMAFVHDELQFEHRAGLHDLIAEASRDAIRDVGRKLNFRGELAVEAKLGANWFECH